MKAILPALNHDLYAYNVRPVFAIYNVTCMTLPGLRHTVKDRDATPPRSGTHNTCTYIQTSLILVDCRSWILNPMGDTHPPSHWMLGNLITSDLMTLSLNESGCVTDNSWDLFSY